MRWAFYVPGCAVGMLLCARRPQVRALPLPLPLPLPEGRGGCHARSVVRRRGAQHELRSAHAYGTMQGPGDPGVLGLACVIQCASTALS